MKHEQQYCGTTEWYEGWQQPLYIGVYQRITQLGEVVYAYWNGCMWSAFCSTANAAEECCGMKSSYPDLKWRGRAIYIRPPIGEDE